MAQFGPALEWPWTRLMGVAKKMHLFRQIWRGDELLATGEHMLIDVNLETRGPLIPRRGSRGPIWRSPWPRGGGSSGNRVDFGSIIFADGGSGRHRDLGA